MLERIRRQGQEEYVPVRYIAREANRSVPELQKMKFFDGIPFKVTYKGTKHYHLDTCLKKLAQYGMHQRAMKYPTAKWRPCEIIADLGIHSSTYLRMVKKGLIKVQPADDYGKFIYWKDYEWFLKNYVPSKWYNKLPKTMNVNDSATFIGIGPGQLRYAAKMGKVDIVYRIDKRGNKRYRWLTSDQIISYINRTLDEAKYKATALMRERPLPDKLSSNLASIYMKISRRYLAKLVAMGILHPEKVKKGRRYHNYFDKAELDRAYDGFQQMVFYGTGRKFYTKANIRNKYGKTDYWISELVAGKCRVVCPCNPSNYRTSSKKVLDPETYAKLNAEERANGRPGYPMFGWFQEDVDAIVASGAEVDQTIELTEFRKQHMKNLDKTNYRALRAKEKKAEKKRIRTKKQNDNYIVCTKPPLDEFEASLKAAMMEQELRSEQHADEVKRQIYEVESERNQLRRLLGIKEKSKVVLSAKTLIRHSDIPLVVAILYRRRSANSPVLYKKHVEGDLREVTMVASDTPLQMKRKLHAQMSVFLNIARTAKRIIRYGVKKTPSWIVLAHTSSVIYDQSFLRKLANVPSEYGAVGAFGYGYVLPDGTWTRCPETYGMYSEVSINDGMMSKRVAGTVSVTGMHEVAVLDGPFVAIRGGYLRMLLDFNKLYRFGDGRGCVPYVISMIMRRMGVKMCQIEVDCSLCTELNAPYTQMEWNAIEPKLLALSQKVLRPKELDKNQSIGYDPKNVVPRDEIQT